MSNIKIGDSILVINKPNGEVKSTIVDIVDDNTIVVELSNGEQHTATIDKEGVWVVSEELSESLLRSNSKRQLQDLNKTIKKSGGDIQDKVRKSEKRKENKMPNAYYMDNPFDSKRKSIDTWEDFITKEAHYKSEPMKSRDPKPNRHHTDSKLSTMKMVKENISGPLKTMPAHHQTYIYPNFTEDERTLLKELDIALYKFNFKNDSKIMMSFKSPESKGEAYELMLINVNLAILSQLTIMLKEFDFEIEYDGKGRLFLDMYYYDKKHRNNRPNRIDESKKDRIIPNTKLNNLKNFYQICMDDEYQPNRVCKQKSNIDDDTWVRGSKDDLSRPMFKNLPDAKIRHPYDTLRAGKWVNMDGTDVRINGLEKGKVLVDIIDEDGKHKTVEYSINDFLKKIKKPEDKK